MGWVYALRCVPTGELYVGSTHMDLQERHRRHQSALWFGNAPPSLQERYDEYGDVFEMIPLKSFPSDQLDQREREAILRLRPALNRNVPNVGVSPALARYRRDRGIAMDAPKYGPRRRCMVRGEMLTAPEIAERYDLPQVLVRGRMGNGEDGERIIRRRSTHTRRRGRV